MKKEKNLRKKYRTSGNGKRLLKQEGNEMPRPAGLGMPRRCSSFGDLGLVGPGVGGFQEVMAVSVQNTEFPLKSPKSSSHPLFFMPSKEQCQTFILLGFIPTLNLGNCTQA